MRPILVGADIRLRGADFRAELARLILKRMQRLEITQRFGSGVPNGMPTPATSNLPIPKDWNEFEEICADLFSNEWGDRNATRNGRQGQRQEGAAFPISGQRLRPSTHQARSSS